MRASRSAAFPSAHKTWSPAPQTKAPSAQACAPAAKFCLCSKRNHSKRWSQGPQSNWTSSTPAASTAFLGLVRFSRNSRGRYLRRFRRGNHHHADQHEHSPQYRPQPQLFPAKKISQHHCHHRVHVRIRSHLRRRFMMQQPHIRRERDDRARHNQIQQRDPCPARNVRPMKIPVFSKQARDHRQKHSPGQHLRPRTHHFRIRQRQLPRQRRRNRPVHRRHNQRHRPQAVNRRPTEIQRPAHQHHHSSQANQQRRHQTHRKPLRAQNENFPKRHEHRDRRHHHSGQPRSHALLRPKHQSVIPHKNQKRNQSHRRPFPSARPPLSPPSRPSVKRHSRNQESQPRQQKRRHLPHPDPDRIIRRSPNKINNRERQQRLPLRPMCFSIHSSSAVQNYHARRHPASHHSTHERDANFPLTNI